MIYEKAYAKTNLALEVKEKVNNFHNVNNIMIPINLYDELFFEKSNSSFCYKRLGRKIYVPK